MLSEVEELDLWWQVLTPPVTGDRPLRGEIFGGLRPRLVEGTTPGCDRRYEQMFVR